VARIRVLPEVLASQVAAGEVVERPASAVKELVENSLDAGASDIRVEIGRGGAALIRVSDDGCGMSREDALLALERHATSKLPDEEALAAVRSLGFRGEAVPSIASVSRFTLTTREREAIGGTELRVEGGVLGEVREAGCAPGTVCEVRELFFNVPARRKFLRSEATESAHVEQQLRRHALAAAGVRLRLRRDGREVFDLPAGMSRLERLRWMIGTERGAELIAIPPAEIDGVEVEGFVLPARHARRGRRHQQFFLNGRPVEDAALSAGVREGFRRGLPEGHQPAVWLWVALDPRRVDVNVHPAKREIRLQRPHEVREAIAAAVREGLAAAEERRRQAARQASAVAASPTSVGGSSASLRAAPVVDEALPLEAPAAEPTPASVPTPRFRLIGTLLARFALLESDEGLVLLDPRAARERILFERWLGGGDAEESQRLLVAELLEAEPREKRWLLDHRSTLGEAGFELEDFGGNTLRLSAVPASLRAERPGQLLRELADELLDQGGPTRRFAREQVLKAMARRAAAREPARPQEAIELLEALFRCELPYCAVDGRPTLSEMSVGEIEKRFGLRPGGNNL